MPGALLDATASAPAPRSPDRSAAPAALGGWAFAAVAICSLGGPLALAALMAPGLLDEAGGSAGLIGLAGLVVALAPLAVWLRFSDRVHGPAGLSGFVAAAAGRRVAAVQAAIWVVSYLLYLVYTTVQIVYDLLPAILPGARDAQSALTIALPLALAAVMLAGRTVTLLVLGALAVGQLVLGAALDAVTVAHVSTRVSSFGAGAPAGSLAKAGVQSSLLYVCGSLPLFLGGDLRAPQRTIRRVLPAAFVLTGAVVTLALAPLAAAPGLGATAVPGMTVMAQYAGPTAARAVGIGVMASVVGVMLCEYLALHRLSVALTAWPARATSAGIGAAMLIATPFVLADPQGVYDALLRPSLIALWLSQLIVFACLPRFEGRQGRRVWPAALLSLVTCAWAIYALWSAITSPAS